MSSFERGEIVVVGAGLVGSLLAYVLTKKGFNVTVFERYGDIRQIPSLGRSINLVLTSRGLRAADAIGGGLREEILSLAVAVTGRVLHQQDGTQQYQPYGKDDSECNYSISRYELNKFLIGKAEEAGAKMYFGHELDTNETDYLDNKVNNGGDVGCILSFKVVVDGVQTKRFINCACPVLGCDGGGSRTRYAMKQQGLTEFTEALLGAERGRTHGYKEILFPRGSGLVPHGLHIWPRSSHMLMALANQDGSMTGTLYMDMDGSSTSFAQLKDPKAAQEFFDQYYGDTIPLIGGVEMATTQMINNPNGLLGTVRTTKWNYRGRVVLLGDAAHAIVPFFGQGMNCGFEDVYQILKLLDSDLLCSGGKISSVATTKEDLEIPVAMDEVNASAWARSFEEFHNLRKTNADAIADLALENFDEMSDRVGDRSFLLQKKVENRIEKCMEHKFRSGYAMICYGGAGNVSYRNAYALSRIQNEILVELIAEPSAELKHADDALWPSLLDSLAQSISMEKAEMLIDQRLVPLQQQLKIDLSTVSHH